MSIDLSNPFLVIRLCLLIVSGQLIISCTELLYNRRIYQPGGLLAWNFIKGSRRFFFKRPVLSRLFGLLFSYPNVLAIIVAELALAILMDWQIVNDRPIAASVWGLTTLKIISGWRNTYSSNGSDQLSNIILWSAGLYMLDRQSTPVAFMAVIFIAFQAELSYLTSGAYKLIHPGWRDGTSLKGILSTRVFGSRHIKLVMDKIGQGYILNSFLLIFGEILLGISFMFPPPLCLASLSIGIFFHLLTAIIMGLNTFVWSFGATYPAIYFVSVQLYK